jgi:signal transduction histidine kinase
MRITYRIFLVGAIPITIAAAIAVVALVLLGEADRARNGAVLAGTIYRNLLAASTARDDFLDTSPKTRPDFHQIYLSHAEQARFDLQRLAGVVRNPQHAEAANQASQALSRYSEQMRRLMDVTIRNDGLIAEMAARADRLIALTDEARDRQHASNADIVTSLSEGDRKLRVAREIVDRAQDFSSAIAALELARAKMQPQRLLPSEAPLDPLTFQMSRMRSAAMGVRQALLAAGRDKDAADFARLMAVYEASMARSPDATLAAEVARSSVPPDRAITDWVGRTLKVYSTEQRTLHDEIAELLTYSVEAHETEQATQEIAIRTLKLGTQAADALRRRDTPAAESVINGSVALGETMASLPISPLIQTEMIEGIEEWRNGLATTIIGLNEQNFILREMNATAARMMEGARYLDAMLTRDAVRIGELVRNILIFGAAVGLLLGGATGLAVARSITRPLKRLQHRMMELADNSEAGPIAGFERRDELGDMARATNVFITEIGRRERALRRSKDRADSALTELQKAQSDLIQAEKLASLGQLVAGIAHEINTPLGVALTTSTLLGEESKRFGEAAGSGKLPRSALERFVQRMGEGSQMLYANLTRAADLVHSFKQVAADQASGDRREFEMSGWLQDLLTSLSPVVRKTRHEIATDCPPGIVLDSYPGALGQVITNLITNAVAHAYDKDEAGKLSISVSQPGDDTVRIVFADDGKGIPPENQKKVFDPFFTTGRSTGSTGLGLHIVFNLVTSRLHGRIDLQSRPGKGTRFVIDLPRVAGEASVESAPERLPQLQGA